jgi:hypothetical protein
MKAETVVDKACDKVTDNVLVVVVTVVEVAAKIVVDTGVVVSRVVEVV